MQVSFLDPVQWFLLCEKTLETSEVKKFAQAIEDDFYFEMFLEVPTTDQFLYFFIVSLLMIIHDPMTPDP